MPNSGPHCSGIGTLNVVDDTCACPLAHEGAQCELPRLPACALRLEVPALRALFWVSRITGSAWDARRGTAPAPDAMGPLPCDCVLQLLRLTRRYRSKWTTTPTEVACVEGVRNLRELLDAPSAARTVHMRLTPSLYAARPLAPPRRANATAWASWPGRLVPVARCPQRCGLAGWCFERGSRPECACFHEALRDASGSCARLTHASPPTPRSRLSTAWGAGVGDAMVGRAAGVSGGLPLVEASGRDTRFNYMHCPLNCSGHGRCDLHAFCACDEGHFGLDCGLTRGSDGRPSAWRAAGAATARPRIYVYDLPVELRHGPQLLLELDHAIGERILLSHHREADPLAADYFWILGPSHEPLTKLRAIAQRWPFWNSSVAADRGARHVLSLLGEQGAARQTRDRDEGVAGVALDDAFEPSSPRRQWLALTLNGIADMERGDARKCHVCFQPGKDVVIAPPPGHTDVPSCAALRKLSAEDAAGEEQRPHRFFWAGRVVAGAHAVGNPTFAAAANVRETLLRLRAEDPAFNASGFAVFNSARRGARVNATEYMLHSQFCWAPPGQRYGDARRHLLAAFHGCIPVLTVPHGHHTFEEALPWRQMALVVPPERLASLPSILRGVTPADARRMRDELRRQRQRLWYASIYGECGAAPAPPAPEDAVSTGVLPDSDDAFAALMRIFADRLR